MKMCTGGCRIEQPEENFPWKNKSLGIRQSFCKTCKSRYNKNWYQKNKEKHKSDVAKNNKIRYSEYRDIIRPMKEQPCVDCGNKYPYYVMDFDHLEDCEKIENISQMKGWSKDKLLDEIAKCEIVCSNCHRIRTFKRNASVSPLPPKELKA